MVRYLAEVIRTACWRSTCEGKGLICRLKIATMGAMHICVEMLLVLERHVRLELPLAVLRPLVVAWLAPRGRHAWLDDYDARFLACLDSCHC